MTATANARTLAQLTPDARNAVLATLSSDELATLEYAWEFWARPDQLPPDPDLWPLWRVWLMLAGRGAGKTRAAAECVVISTTPKPGPLLKEIIAAPTTVLTRARTLDNRANLSSCSHVTSMLLLLALFILQRHLTATG